MDKNTEATDRASIDYHYFVRGRLPEWETHIEDFSARSAEVRQQLSHHSDVPYGWHDRHKIDIFPPYKKKTKKLPAMVFIHGGYWRMLDKSVFSFLVPEYLSLGVVVALINYRLLPDVGLSDIVEDVKDAAQWLTKNANEFDIDPNNITLCGHSAGAHLAAHAVSEMNANFIGISGVYDLEPIQNSFLNDIGFLTQETTDAFGSASILPKGRCYSLFAFGKDEGVEFARQSLSQAELWRINSSKVKILPVDATNHATIVSEFANPHSDLFKSSSKLINQRVEGYSVTKS